MYLDLDLDLNFSKWILDYGFNFFHGFGLVISNGYAVAGNST